MAAGSEKTIFPKSLGPLQSQVAVAKTAALEQIHKRVSVSFDEFWAVIKTRMHTTVELGCSVEQHKKMRNLKSSVHTIEFQSKIVAVACR